MVANINIISDINKFMLQTSSQRCAFGSDMYSNLSCNMRDVRPSILLIALSIYVRRDLMPLGTGDRLKLIARLCRISYVT